MTKILIVDDNPHDRMLFRYWANAKIPDAEIIEATNADDAFEAILEAEPDFVVIDQMMPGTTGFVAIHEWVGRIPNWPSIFLVSNAMTEDLRRNAIALGAVEGYHKLDVARGELVDEIVKMTDE